jgi:hypothetical protein
MQSQSERSEYLRSQYENVLGWYKQAEDKAKFLVTVNTFLAAAINGLVFAAKPEIRWPYLLLLASLAFMTSFAFLLQDVWARHRPGGASRDSETSLNEDEKLWFFGHISAMTREEHRRAVQNWSPEKLETTMTAEVYILSRNVQSKFDALNRAIIATVAGVLLLFALSVVQLI